MKKVLTILLLIILITLTSCGRVNTSVDVFWMNNDSVKALKSLAKNELIINMS